MKSSVVRILERAGGIVLIGTGLVWLVMGLRSVMADGFFFRGAFVVLLISSLLILGGIMLAKPQASRTGRMLALMVCVLGAFRELMLLDHQPEISIRDGDWIGLTLVVLYGTIAVLVVSNYMVERRTATE